MNIAKVSPEFAADLIKLVNGLKGVTYNAAVDYTTKSGGRTKFEYVTLDKIYSLVKADNNFAVLEPLGTDDQGQSALQVILIHRTGEVLASDYYKIRVNENGSKQDEGAAITYTKRYALGSFLGLCTEEDTDANVDGDSMPLSGSKTTKPRVAAAQPQETPVKVSEPQLKKLYAMARSLGVKLEEEVAARFKLDSPADMTKEQASGLIENFMARQKQAS